MSTNSILTKRTIWTSGTKTDESDMSENSGMSLFNQNMTKYRNKSGHSGNVRFGKIQDHTTSKQAMSIECDEVVL
jgi:predicted PilT family ATPase